MIFICDSGGHDENSYIFWRIISSDLIHAKGTFLHHFFFYSSWWENTATKCLTASLWRQGKCLTVDINLYGIVLRNAALMKSCCSQTYLLKWVQRICCEMLKCNATGMWDNWCKAKCALVMWNANSPKSGAIKRCSMFVLDLFTSPVALVHNQHGAEFQQIILKGEKKKTSMNILPLLEIYNFCIIYLEICQ